jgi:cell wall assembly regulator SMI1
MQALDALIDRMDRWLAAHRPAYYAQLQPGATDAELSAFEARFSLRLPDDFRQFYRWRNGQDAACYESLQFNRMFSSLQDVAETKALFDGMIGSDFDDPQHWRRGWVPFLHNGGGNHLCLDINAGDGGQPDQLVAFWKADADRPIEFPSLHALLGGLVASMEDGSLDVT